MSLNYRKAPKEENAKVTGVERLVSIQRSGCGWSPTPPARRWTARLTWCARVSAFSWDTNTTAQRQRQQLEATQVERPAGTHLRVRLRVHPHHVLGARGPHKGARPSVLAQQGVDGLLQACRVHHPRLGVVCVDHPAVGHLKKQKKKPLSVQFDSDTGAKTLVC